MLSFIKREDFQFVRVFNVHDLITDIVSCFYEVDKWMTCVVIFTKLDNA